jgi:hypothetical protein
MSVRMKMTRSKRILLIVTGVILLIVLGFFLEKRFRHRYHPPTNTAKQNEIPLKYQSLATCKAEDRACATNNEKIKADRLTGSAVEYAKHQCDGPRACPLPDATTDATAIKAIRDSIKNPNLEVIRITGINPAGIIYYCAEGNKCWKVDSKTKAVTTY